MFITFFNYFAFAKNANRSLELSCLKKSLLHLFRKNGVFPFVASPSQTRVKKCLSLTNRDFSLFFLWVASSSSPTRVLYFESLKIDACKSSFYHSSLLLFDDSAAYSEATVKINDMNPIPMYMRTRKGFYHCAGRQMSLIPMHACVKCTLQCISLLLFSRRARQSFSQSL